MEIWKIAEDVNKREFEVKKDRLIWISHSKRGDEVIQLIIPKKFRKDILKLCHDDVSGHLGVQRTKDRVLLNFFWPNCYKVIETYVKTCHECQIVGKPRDKKKVPLKLTPIILEPFSKLAIDAIGPLPITGNNNRYAITAICCASKYPVAIPIPNLSCINYALIQIFSQTGYPKQIQCNLGTSFTSELTTLFFDKFNNKVNHSSVAHPESNSVERMYSTLKRIIKVLCLESGSDWERVLPMALFVCPSVCLSTL